MSRVIVFGEIPGLEEGQWFKGKKEMMPSTFQSLMNLLKNSTYPMA